MMIIPTKVHPSIFKTVGGDRGDKLINKSELRLQFASRTCSESGPSGSQTEGRNCERCENEGEEKIPVKTFPIN